MNHNSPTQLAKAAESLPKINEKSNVPQALHSGDEFHNNDDSQVVYPLGFQLFVIIIALILSMFLVNQIP